MADRRRTKEAPEPVAAAAQPRYMQVMLELRRRIATSEYPVGELIPTEAELCKEFLISRHTAREALRRLTDLGVLERKQGVGTLVRTQVPTPAFVQSYRSLSDLFQYALDTHYAIAEAQMTAVTAEEAAVLRCEEQETWLTISGVRRVRPSGEVICHTRVLVSPRFAWLKEELLVCAGPLYGLIEERAQEAIREAIQTIEATILPEPVRAALGEQGDTCAMRVTRRYLDQAGHTMLCSVNYHPAGKLTYTTRLTRDPLD